MGFSLDVGSANPGAARAAAQDLGQAARQAAELGVQIARTVSAAVGPGVWTGAAAEAFANHMKSRVQAADAIAGGLQQGAGVLDNYAGELARAKAEWDSAMAQVQGLPEPLKGMVLAGEAIVGTPESFLSSLVSDIPFVGHTISSAIFGQAKLAGAQLMAAEALAIKAAADCALGLNSALGGAQEAEGLLGNVPHGALANIEDFRSGLRGAEINFGLSMLSLGGLVGATEEDPNATAPDWEQMGKSIIDDPGGFAKGIVNWDQISQQWESGHPGAAMGDGLFTLGSLAAAALGGESLGGDAAASAGRAAAEAGAEDAARAGAEGAAGSAADGAPAGEAGGAARGGSSSPAGREDPGSTTGGIGPVQKGQTGVEKSIQAAEARGETVVGTEVTIDTSGGRVRVDVVARDRDGNLIFIESKNGPHARFTPNQKVGYPLIETQGGIPQGRNAAAAGLAPGEPIGPTPVEIDWW